MVDMSFSFRKKKRGFGVASDTIIESCACSFNAARVSSATCEHNVRTCAFRDATS